MVSLKPPTPLPSFIAHEELLLILLFICVYQQIDVMTPRSSPRNDIVLESKRRINLVVYTIYL